MATAKCKKSIREDGTGVDFVFSNGETRSVVIADLPAAIVTNLVLHGVSQKVGDSYAGQETVDNCIEKADELIKRLNEGDWKTVRAAGGSKRSSMVLEAFARASGRTTDECREIFDEMDDDQQEALKSHEAITPHIAAIRAERALEKAKKLAEKNQGATLDL